jgi:ubiquinone/menaquinone biosynthesis C-methylase UbiE
LATTPSLSFDRVAEIYDQSRGGEARGERLARDLEPFLDPAAPVLEIGVGTGIVAAPLARRGFRILGLDLSPAMILRARERLGSRVVLGDARRLPVRDGAVVQSYAVWALHVTGDIPGVLHEVGRALRPGGRLLVCPQRAPRPDDPRTRRFDALERTLDPQGKRDDSEERLRRLAPEAGFRVTETRLSTRRTSEIPALTAAKLEARAYSFLWNVSERDWSEHVRPLIEELRAAPDAEEPVEVEWIDQVVVMERENGGRSSG